MPSLKQISRELSKAVSELRFGPPVTHVYDPLVYARKSHEAYLERFGSAPKTALLVGMNPGPFGMAQTGVPFGEIAAVRDWMGIEAAVAKPENEHPRRPIDGFACERSEVSGRRLWGWAAERFGEASSFFETFFVHNYCPLVFMEETGRNRTPDKLPAEERDPLFEACDRALKKVVKSLEVELVVGVGAFAEKRARDVLGDSVRTARVLHPSPASPLANRDWPGQATKTFEELGLMPS